MDVKTFRHFIDDHPHQFKDIVVRQFKNHLQEDVPGAFKHQIVECTYDLIAHIQPNADHSMSLYYLEQMYHFFHGLEMQIASKLRRRMLSKSY